MRLSGEKVLIVVLVFILVATMDVELAASDQAALAETVIRVEPSLVEFGNPAGDPIPVPGTQFTVAVRVYNVTNLYGFDLKFRWNTTFLDYVGHSVHVPRDTYTDGVLWNLVIPVADQVNTTEGTYEVACASMAPAPSFNGTGTVFTMTFEVKMQPYDYETGGPEVDSIDTVLNFSSTDLAPRVSEGSIVPIAHSVEPTTVRIWEKRSELPAYPILKIMPTGVENLPMNSTFDIDIWIIGVDPKYDIQSFNVTLSFNSTLVEAVGITEGQWLKSYAENTTETTKQVDNVNGTITYALEQIPPTHPPATTNGILFTVTFQVVYESLEFPPPSCELTLGPTEILDENLGLLAHTTENSTYTAYRPLPVAEFTWSPSSSILLRGQTITFNASGSYHPLGSKITLYTWDFGDGIRENTTDPIITYAYTKSGDFTVVLNVTDYGGFQNYASTLLHISEPPPEPYLAVDPPYLKFGPHPPQVVGKQFNVSIYIKSLNTTWSLQNTKFSLSYNDSLIDIMGDLANVTVWSLWRGPNNVTILRQPNGIANVTITLSDPSVPPSEDVALTVTIRFTLVHQGTYPSADTSLLTLSDIELMGTIGEIPTQPPVQGQIDIKGLSQPLQTSFEYSPLNPRTNENVTFDASGSSQNDFNITDYVWNFGDGNITSVRVPVVTHCYSTPQTYNVTLTVTDIDGLNSAVLKTITIEPAVAAVPLDVTPYAIAIVALVIVAAAGVYFIKIRKPRDENKTRRKR